jgi:hypothetical protein
MSGIALFCLSGVRLAAICSGRPLQHGVSERCDRPYRSTHHCAATQYITIAAQKSACRDGDRRDVVEKRSHHAL